MENNKIVEMWLNRLTNTPIKFDDEKNRIYYGNVSVELEKVIYEEIKKVKLKNI